MAGFKRRRFTRRSFSSAPKRRSFSRKKKFTRAKTTQGSSTSVNSAVSKIDFKLSKFSKQIVPDRFFTWLTIENQGFTAGGAGSNVGTFGFALNDIVLPLNKPGPTAVTIPGPVQAVNAWNEQGLKNFLFNTATNTGLYNNFRIWTSIANVTFSLANAADAAVNAVLLPLSQAATAYPNPEAMEAAPNSVVKTCAQGSAGASCTLTCVASAPALYGVPKNLFPSFASALGSFSATPGLPMFWQVGWRTAANAVLNNALGIKVLIQYKVEFCNRVDAGLLQT